MSLLPSLVTQLLAPPPRVPPPSSARREGPGQRRRCERVILAAMQAEPDRLFAHAQIVEALPDCDINAIDRTLRAALDAGRIVRVRRGLYQLAR